MITSWEQEKIVEIVRKATMRGIVRATEMVRTEAIDLILSTQKTGRIYRRRGVEHQASAPGEAPASDTGRLVQSTTTRYDHAQLVGYVSVGAEYGAHLEFGTQKMEPRPFLRPALANKNAEIDKIIAEEVDAALA